MPRPRLFIIVLTVLAAVVVSPAYARCDTLERLTYELDRAQDPAEFASLAARLELFVSGKDGGSAAAYSELARAYYLQGEAETLDDRRLELLGKALTASEKALAADPRCPYAIYWRSMARLQKADMVGGLSALRMVKRALRDFESIETVIPAYDGAGAYRSHGKVLMEAPAWAFIGDKIRGLELLEKAREISPATLINRLYLAQAYIEAGRRVDALRELRYIEKAPAGSLRPMDDLKVKQDASRILDEIGGR